MLPPRCTIIMSIIIEKRYAKRTHIKLLSKVHGNLAMARYYLHLSELSVLDRDHDPCCDSAGGITDT